MTVGAKELGKAVAILQKYKQGKSNLEKRVVEDEEWYKLRHWDYIRGQKYAAAKPAEKPPEPASAWLFSTLANKHADAMDNYPEPNVLPREQGDRTDATTLSAILPVILERNDFEDTYSRNWWEKLKHGTAVYGIFWDKTLENGLGDISVTSIDLLNIFWEPGVTDIQRSRNVFIVNLQDNDLLESEYPQLTGKLKGGALDLTQYRYDDTVDVSDKAAVIDWYYKMRTPEGRTVLHYVKFVGDTLLYASETDESYAVRGFYDHGEYPVVFDTLFPEKGTPVGFGYIAVTKDPQLYIDKLSQNILTGSMMATRPRFFASTNTGVNEEEFLDWSKPIVHVEGQINEERLRQIEVNGLDGIYLNVLQMKIDELKETSSNRDFSSGGTASGVTAAAAIAALQEAGNKTSRDMIAAAYRSYTAMSYLCIELLRQFYDEERSFRITGQDRQEAFISYSNANLRDQALPPAYPGAEAEEGYAPMFRRPVFDIKIRAQKRSPYSRMAQNELAKELYGMGFFDPARAQMSLAALELMEFEGKDGVVAYVQQGQTLMNVVQQMQAEMEQMRMVIGVLAGREPAAAGDGGTSGLPRSARNDGRNEGPKTPVQDGVARAQRGTMTAYGDKLAARAPVNMDAVPTGALPG